MKRGLLTRIALTLVLGLVVGVGLSPPARTLAADNPIVVENQQTGSTGWLASRLADDASGQIKGYASATSVRQTESLTFHITVNPVQTYTIDVYRVGWYAGMGGRLRLHVGPLGGVRQPPCDSDASTGLRACSWAPSHTITVPADWTSGVYLALLTNAQGFQNYVTFVVRDGRPAPFLYQRSVATDQAYNNYPSDGSTGKSLHSFNSFGATTVSGETRAVKVSFDRPYAGAGAGLFGNAEINFVRWLERTGYDATYSTDVDTHASGGELLSHRAFLSVGQNEYWSKEMYDAAEAARNAGVSLGFFGAAAVEVQARFEPSAAGVANRVLVAYKDAALDPVQGATTTVVFRNPPVNRPEQSLRGVQALFTSLPTNIGYVVTNSSHWVYEGTASSDGDVVPGIVGRQVDRFQTAYPPANSAAFALLSQSPFTDATGVPNVAHSSIYQAPSGAWVFSAGTTSWSWALDDFAHNLASPRIQRATANILNAFLNGAPVRALAIATPATVTARKAFAVSVAAKDPAGNTATWYTGTVHFSSSDTSSGVALPPDTTLINGQGTFFATLATEGSQTVTASDPARALTATATLTVAAPAPPSLAGLHVAGNRLVDPAGQSVVLHGVARSGTEYACVEGTGIFDGPSDAASIAAIKSWGANAVRVPLNEACWLGINGVPAALGGVAYQQAIADYVSLLNQNGLYAILDLHWSAPGTVLANMQQPMPDMDHSPTFWSQVASAFGDNGAVILELFNEPFPDGNQDSVAAWTTWRDGGSALLRDTTTPYQAAGMQTLVDAVRATGATNVIALGGVQFSNTLTRWLEHKPTDPLNNLAAAWHIYNFNACSTVACFDSTGAPVAALVPLIVTETGMNACDATFSDTVLDWLDAHHVGYLAWAWTTFGNDCATNALVVDYAGTPTTKGQIYKAHIAPATHLALSTDLATRTAGTAFSFTVTARDQFGHTDPTYAGTLRFTSSDTSAGRVVPADSTLTNAQGTFTATLAKAGPQTITATDSVTGSITATLAITVRAAGATHLALATTAAPAAGASFPFSATALDQFGNTDTGYAGSVHFTSSDTSAGAVLPADSTLTDGQGTFAATLTTTGSQTITATDTVTATITGSMSVTVAAAPPPPPPPPASFPVVLSVTASSFATDAAAHAVALPATVEPGDLLIGIFANDGGATISAPSGWTSLGTNANGTAVRVGFYMRRATGAEDGTTVNVQTSAAEKAVAQVYRIQAGTWRDSGTLSSDVVKSAISGTSATPDPFLLNPVPWDVENTLWIAYYGADNDEDVGAYPASYTGGTYTESDASTTSVSLGSARRALAAASDDPGTFTIAAVQEWVAGTIAVRPAAGVAP